VRAGRRECRRQVAKLVPVEAFATMELNAGQQIGYGYRESKGAALYRSMTQMIGETRMEALAAAEASAAKRRPRLEVFHALSCAFDVGFTLSL
jgi:hypothetical protein